MISHNDFIAILEALFPKHLGTSVSDAIPEESQAQFRVTVIFTFCLQKLLKKISVNILHTSIKSGDQSMKMFPLLDATFINNILWPTLAHSIVKQRFFSAFF